MLRTCPSCEAAVRLWLLHEISAPRAKSQSNIEGMLSREVAGHTCSARRSCWQKSWDTLQLGVFTRPEVLGSVQIAVGQLMLIRGVKSTRNPAKLCLSQRETSMACDAAVPSTYRTKCYDNLQTLSATLSLTSISK